MADEVDRANDLAEVLLAATVGAVRPRMKPTGHCYFCNETLMDSLLKGSLFCDEHCRNDYEQQEKMRRINGR